MYPSERMNRNVPAIARSQLIKNAGSICRSQREAVEVTDPAAPRELVNDDQRSFKQKREARRQARRLLSAC